MAICEWCGKEFKKTEATDIFESEFHLEYGNIRKCLCGHCAIQAIQDEVEDVYYETCDRCNKVFDLIEESYEFEKEVCGTDLRDYWNRQILCCECALKEIR